MPVETLDGIETDAPIVMVDPATAGSDRGNMGWLRSLPYLCRQGVTDYTFAQSWLSYGTTTTFEELFGGDESPFAYTVVPSLEFRYHLFGSDATWRDISAQHLCQFTSQETEAQGVSSTTQKLLRGYNEGNIQELILVVDRSDFVLADAARRKPLTETLSNVGEFGYEGAATYYIKHELPTNYLSLDETLNVWLHEAAIEYATEMDREPNRIADLFDFSEVHPAVRTWDFFEFLATQTTKEDTDHVQATIRPWIEADISLVRDHILNELQVFEFDADQVRSHRAEYDV
jgi:hypothetical protein